jgi:predicted DNA-binding transcriptional regulator AlpA
METILDARGVARKLGITVSAVHRLAARGTLPSTWLAGVRIWKLETVERYLVDEVAQKRRRNGALITQGTLELTVDDVVSNGLQRNGKVVF